MFLLSDQSGGIMETSSCIKKTISVCCRTKEERRRKLQEEYLEKSFDRYFERGIITYLRCRSMSRIILKHCDGCSIGDPSQRHYEGISKTYLEWIAYKFDETLHKVDFYIVYELTKSLLMDSFSMEEIDESLSFFFPESFLSDVTWCKGIKQKLIMSHMEDEN